MGDVVAPAVEEVCHVGGELGIEKHLLTSTGVDETECAGMKCLTGTDIEASLYKLTVAARGSAFQNLVTSVAFVVEERMADMLHVDTNLMGPARLQLALHEGDVA